MPKEVKIRSKPSSYEGCRLEVDKQDETANCFTCHELDSS